MDTTHTDRQHEGMASAPSTASATENENGPMPDAGAYLPTASLLTPAAIAARDAAIDHGSSALENATSRNDESEAPPSSVSSSGGEMATDSGGNQHGLLDELEDAASSVNANEASHSHGHMICQPVASPAPGDVATAATGDIPSIAVTIAPLAGDAITPVHRRSNSSGTASVDNGNHNSNRKKRLCRFPGCTRVIKSQGHCQRHGAKAKRCKVEGCEKQAQGTHNGMCKRHWRAVHFPDQVAAKAEAERKKQEEEQPPPPVGESVYDTILPASIAYRPSSISVVAAEKNAKEAAIAAAVAAGAPEVSEADVGTDDTHTAQTPALESGSAHNVASTGSVPSSNNIVSAMPLVTFLRDGALQKEVGWHRQAERRARGMFECPSLSCQLEPWEKQLALVEILLLSGGTPHANFKDLAHAWGRERGFHQVLASSVCTRRGEVERKKRSDAGKRGTVSMSVSTSTAAAATSSLTSQSPSAAASAAASASATVPHRKRAKFNTLQQQQQTLQQQVQQIQEQQLQSQQQQLQHQLQQVQFQQQVQHQLHLQQQFQQVQFQQNPTTPPVLLPQGQQPAQQLSELATTTTAATTNAILAMASGAPETALLSTNTNNDSPTAGSSDDINTAVNAAVNGNTEGITTASINLGASGGVGMGGSTGIP